MAKMSSSDQQLAAAVGDFELGDRGVSTPILGTVPRALFVQAFSLWFEVRTEAQCLPSSAARGDSSFPFRGAALRRGFLRLGAISRAVSAGSPAPCHLHQCSSSSK